MNVGQLIELLRTLPEQARVILSKDSEGNNFSPLSDWQIGLYTAASSWTGHFDPADQKRSGEEDLPNNAVCLYPMN